MIQVGIIMGSDSDLMVMQDAAKILDELAVESEVSIVSAHRTPEQMFEYAKSAEERGIKVIIAGAGGSAHLPGMIAACTHVPVIGVPIMTKTMSGIDSLLSIAQMPAGIPVATVAVNGAKNAGILAAEILAVSDASLKGKLIAYRKGLEKDVLDKAQDLGNTTIVEYLKNHG